MINITSVVCDQKIFILRDESIFLDFIRLIFKFKHEKKKIK